MSDDPGALAAAEARVAGVRDDPAARLALLGGSAGEPSSQAVRLWLAFGADPSGRNWYRSRSTSSATSPTSSASAGCSTTP